MYYLSVFYRCWEDLWRSFLGIFVHLIGLIGSIFIFTALLLPIAGLIMELQVLFGKDPGRVNVTFGTKKLNPLWVLPVCLITAVILYYLGRLLMIGTLMGLQSMPWRRF